MSRIADTELPADTSEIMRNNLAGYLNLEA